MLFITYLYVSFKQIFGIIDSLEDLAIKKSFEYICIFDIIIQPRTTFFENKFPFILFYFLFLFLPFWQEKPQGPFHYLFPPTFR